MNTTISMKIAATIVATEGGVNSKTIKLGEGVWREL